MSKPPAGPHGVDAKAKVIHLSQLLGATVVSPSGEPIGRVDDIIVRLPSAGTKAHSRVTIVWDQLPPQEWADGHGKPPHPNDPGS